MRHTAAHRSRFVLLAHISSPAVLARTLWIISNPRCGQKCFGEHGWSSLTAGCSGYGPKGFTQSRSGYETRWFEQSLTHVRTRTFRQRSRRATSAAARHRCRPRPVLFTRATKALSMALGQRWIPTLSRSQAPSCSSRKRAYGRRPRARRQMAQDGAHPGRLRESSDADRFVVAGHCVREATAARWHVFAVDLSRDIRRRPCRVRTIVYYDRRGGAAQHH